MMPPELTRLFDQYPDQPVTFAHLRWIVAFTLDSNEQNKIRNLRLAAAEKRLDALDGQQTPDYKAVLPAKPRWRHRGAWQDGTQYGQDDLVLHEGRAYRCLASATIEPPTSATSWSAV